MWRLSSLLRPSVHFPRASHVAAWYVCMHASLAWILSSLCYLLHIYDTFAEKTMWRSYQHQWALHDSRYVKQWDKHTQITFTECDLSINHTTSCKSQLSVAGARVQLLEFFFFHQRLYFVLVFPIVSAALSSPPTVTFHHTAVETIWPQHLKKKKKKFKKKKGHSAIRTSHICLRWRLSLFLCFSE